MEECDSGWLTEQVSILIVDDHPLFRDGLNSALSLEDDLCVIGQCEDGDSALVMVKAHQPDVVLLDVNLPSKNGQPLNGLQVARSIKAESPITAIVVLTAYHDSEQVLHAMRGGASAYCAKDITPTSLIDTIRAAAAGYYVVGTEKMDWQSLQRWINSSMETLSPHMIDPDEHYIPLSPREMEILQFVTNGMSNKEIAIKLRISQQTVKNHMTSILKKLNVQDRTQAAVTALRRGWVRLQIDSPAMTDSN
jgi:DNA-binding NarL/FixJ family response regulator